MKIASGHGLPHVSGLPLHEAKLPSPALEEAVEAPNVRGTVRHAIAEVRWTEGEMAWLIASVCCGEKGHLKIRAKTIK